MDKIVLIKDVVTLFSIEAQKTFPGKSGVGNNLKLNEIEVFRTKYFSSMIKGAFLLIVGVTVGAKVGSPGFTEGTKDRV